MRIISWIISVLLLSTLPLAQQSFAGDQLPEPLFRKGVVVFKVTPEIKIDLPVDGSLRFGHPEIDLFLDDIDADKVERTFPFCFPPEPGGTDLTRIFTVYFDESLPVDDVRRGLAKREVIEYADRWTIERYSLDHNDRYRDRQWGMNVTESNAAHDISTGDRSVAVAIVDSGMDMDHPDLVPNLWINPGEDLNRNGVIDDNERNGRDDDGNGRIDDFNGWDFVGNDNNPDDVDRSGYRGHGTHCAGIASAKTNNEIGVASIGYNCGILPVRTGSGGFVQYGYHGIEYATRTGAKVVSCSWGGYEANNWTRDVVNYAYEHDVLVIAAAGNDNTDRLHYPCGFVNVLAVAATGSNDRKANFSNYGDWIDVAAPGVNIYSTFLVGDGSYVYMGGTSMACPFAASLGILIRATYPRMDVDEAWRLLVEGADDIDDDRMGSGRINAFQSLELGQEPAPIISELEIVSDDNDNGKMDPGETVELVVTISNAEDATIAEEVILTLTTDDPTINIENGEIVLENLEPGDHMANTDDPFVIEIDEDAVAHTTWFTVRAEANPGEIIVTRQFEVIIGHPAVLIVDDDGGSDLETWYFQSLENAGLGWIRWDVETAFAPDAEVLTDYDMVIWYTGNTNPPLDELDRWQMFDGIDNGAKVLLIGNRIGNDPDNRDFMIDYFGAEHVADSVFALTALGLPGDRPLAENVQMLLFGNEDAGDPTVSPSAMSPVNGADSLLVYGDPDQVTGVAGVYLSDPDSEKKTVYFGFTFEGVGDRGTPRHEALRQLFAWFNREEEESAPLDPRMTLQEFSLEQAYPNPFNAMINLKFSLPAASFYELAILDMSGRMVSILSSGAVKSGGYDLTWNARGHPSGIYYARLTTPGQSSVFRKLVLLK